MPIYEYECLSCEHEFEKFIKKLDETVECPACKEKKLQKKFSLFARGRSKLPDNSTPSGGGSCGSCVSKDCSNCG